MGNKMFGYRNRGKKGPSSETLPGKPMNSLDMSSGKARDNPKKYEGKEHHRTRR